MKVCDVMLGERLHFDTERGRLVRDGVYLSAREAREQGIVAVFPPNTAREVCTALALNAYGGGSSDPRSRWILGEVAPVTAPASA